MNLSALLRKPTGHARIGDKIMSASAALLALTVGFLTFLTPPAVANWTINAGECSQTVSSTGGVSVSRVGNDCVVVMKADTNWVVPANVTSIRFLLVGGGAGGYRDGGGGGGGGAGATGTVSVTAGNSVGIDVGAGGSGTWPSPQPGGQTRIDLNGDGNYEFFANGGSIGTNWQEGRSGGSGGSAAATNGATHFSGGRGGNGPTIANSSSPASNAGLENGFTSDITGSTLYYGGGGGGGIGAHGNGPDGSIGPAVGGYGGGGSGAAQLLSGAPQKLILLGYRLDGSNSYSEVGRTARCGATNFLPFTTMGWPGLDGYGGGGGGGAAHGDGCQAAVNTGDDGERTDGGDGGDGVVIVRYTIPTAPSAPVITNIVPGDQQFTIRVTAPASDGNTPITDYEYSIDGGSTWVSTNSTSTSITVSGLDNYRTYPVRVRAENGVGAGTQSELAFGTPLSGAVVDLNARVSTSATDTWIEQVGGLNAARASSGFPSWNSSDRLFTFSGSDEIYRNFGFVNPSSFSLELYFKTTDSGVKLLGFQETAQNPTRYDRHLYIDANGYLQFGFDDTSNWTQKLIATPTQVNNGQWHHVVATLDGNWQRLYLDGVEVASLDVSSTARHPFGGFWVVGGGQLTGWPDATGSGTTLSGSPTFQGDIQVARVYNRSISALEVTAAYESAIFLPELSSSSPLGGGFSTQIQNFDSNYSYSASVGTGSASVDSSGLVTVTGMSPGTTQSVSVTQSLSGWGSGSASVSGTSQREFNVSWDSKGGSAVASTTVLELETLSAPANPNKLGYTFAGWSATDGGSAVSFPYAHGANGDFTMYALWSANTYNINWDSNGGSTITSPLTVETGTQISKPTDPIRDGYVFYGWSTSETSNSGDFSNRITSWPYSPPVGQDVNLYAIWYSNNYADITSSSAGSASATGQVLYHPVAILPDRDSWAIEGWFREKAGTYNQNPLMGQGLDGRADSFIVNALPINGRRVLLVDGIAMESAPTLTRERWYHFAYSVNNGTYEFYLNGVLGQTGSLDPRTNFGAFFIGENPYYLSGTARHVFYGFTDQIKIWSDPLTAEEVRISMHTFADEGIAKNLLYHYSFDVAGNPGFDVSGNQNLSTYGSGTAMAFTQFSNAIAFDEKGGSAVADSTFHTFDLVDDPGTPNRSNYSFVGWSSVDGDAGSVVNFPYAPQPFEPSTLYAIWDSTLAVQTPSNATATVGQSFSLQVLASGGTAPLSYSATGLSGLSISSSGEISGTPTQAGTQTVAVTISDADGNSVTTGNFTITVQAASLPTPGALTASATAGVLGSFDVSWSSVTNASSYDLRVYDSSDQLIETISVPAGETARTISSLNGANLSNGTTYKVSISAVGEGNYQGSPESAKVSVNTLNSYTVTYLIGDADTGAVPDPQTKIEDAALTLASNAGLLGKAGYIFIGWNTGLNGSGVSYAEAGNYTSNAPLTLYPEWQDNTYGITWDSNSGSAVTSPESFEFGQTVSEPTRPTRDSFVFGGWSTSESSNQGVVANKVSFPYTPPTAADITLYAIWYVACSPSQSATFSARGTDDQSHYWFGVDGYKYVQQVFTDLDECWWEVPADVDSLDVVIVGGGGSGGYQNRGGGGGAGEVLVSPTDGLDVSPGQQFLIDIGDGGDQAPASFGESGESTFFGNFEALGGGHGAGGTPASDSRAQSESGGSGGGSSTCIAGGSVTSSSANRYPQLIELGNDGGSKAAAACDRGYAGGGGGAGGAGQIGAISNVNNFNGGAGGAGVRLFGRSLAAGGAAWNTAANAGGKVATQTLGGSWTSVINSADADGDDGTGSGAAPNEGSASGGSGIVVVRYISPTVNVTFEPNFSAPDASQVISTDVATNLTANAFVRDGYTFAGWSTVANGVGGASYSDGQEITLTDDLTLYAQWSSNLSVTTPTSIQDGTVGQSYSLQIATSGGATPLTFSAAGLASGLSINSSTGEISGTPTIAGDQTVTVTVSDNDGNSATTSSFTISVNPANLPSVGTPSVTATAGALKSIDVSWSQVNNAASYLITLYDASDAPLTTVSVAANLSSATITTAEYADLLDGTSYKVSVQAIGDGNYLDSAESAKSSVTTLNSYSVTYLAGDAETGTTPDPQTKIEDAALTLASNTGSLGKAGYSFAGWNTGVNGSGISLDDGASYATNAPLTLYPEWTANSNSITWDSNGGSSVSSPATFTTGGQISKPTNPTKAEKIFGGWSTSESAGQGTFAGAITSWPYAPADTSAITLHAIWLSVAPPENIQTTPGDTTIAVTWEAPRSAATEPPTGYRVDYSTGGAPDSTWTQSSVLSSSATSYQITGLTNSTPYYVRVVALYNGEEGAYGYPWTKLYETQNRSRVDGLIDYQPGYGLEDGDAADANSAASFSRVRYRMQANDGALNWADVDFAKTVSSPAAGSATFSIPNLRVPTISGAGSQFEIHGDVSDMRVSSSKTEVVEGVGLTGRLEIWPYDYGADGPLAGGTLGKYDENDLPNQPDNPRGRGEFGSFQVHVLNSPADLVFAWNAHFDARANIGFANNPGGTSTNDRHQDWTFAYNSRSDFKLEIFANIPVAPLAAFTVSFIAGTDASGTTQTLTKTFGNGLTLPDETTANNWFERAGQKVVGWTTSDGGSLTHPLGGTYTGNADEDFYPVWACYSPTVVQTGLILHLDAFNSCSTGTAGKWKDISGNQRDLTWVGTAPTLVQENGKYYDFVEQYGTLTGDGLDDFSNGFSISFYANMFDAGNYARIIDFGNGADNDNIVVSRFGTSNKIILQIQLDQTRYTRCVTPDIIDDSWSQITAVVDTDGTCSFYKNGQAVSPIDQVTALDFATFTPTPRSTNYVGKSNWTGNDLLDAGLGELAIYNRPLSSAEVATNFAAQVPQSYTVTFSYDGADGGERPTEKIYLLGGTAPTLPAPTKTGMLFGGWYSDPGLSTFVGYAGASYTPSSNTTLYARWTNLLINLDGSDDNSLANSGTSWTSVLPGASNVTGQADGAQYFVDGSIEGFEFNGNSSAVEFAQGTAAFDGPITVEAWIQPSGFNTDWNIIASRWFKAGESDVGSKDFHFAIKKFADDDYRLNLYTSPDGNALSANDVFGQTPIDANSSKWYLVGFTIDASGNLQFYINGVADGPVRTGVLRGGDQDSYLLLGDPRPYDLSLIGRMSEFRIYNKALSAAESFATVSAAASTYDLNTIEYRSGSLASGDSVFASKYSAAPISLLDSTDAAAAFTRDGYTITGWATSDGGAEVYELGESFNQNQNLVLYPVWSADTHNFTFDYFTGTSATTFVTDGSVALFTPDRTGYTFDGWSTSQSGGNGVLADKIQTWPYFPGVTTDLTVYAIWSINSHTLSLVSEGNTTTQSVEFGANPADPQSSLQRTGYTLQGWSDGNDATAEYAADLSDYVMPDGDATLYAVWLANTYTITYRAGSFGSGADQVVTKTHDVALTLADADTANSWFLRTSHLVSGWATSDGGAEAYALGATFTVEADTVLYPVWQSTVYSVEASGDTFVVSGTNSNNNYGTSSILLFKNAGANITNPYNRVAYTEFEYDPDFNWIGGVLEVYVSGNADGSRNNGYNITYTSFNVDVFGANDASWDESTLTFNLANNSTQDWGLKTTVFPWNTDGGTYLGTISVPTSPTTVGQKFALATEALDDFLNADADGNVTFYMRRSDIDAQSNLSFASSEHPTLPGPTLTVAGAGYSYTIAYDINGGTGSIPAAGTYIQGGTPYVVAAGSGVIPPSSKTFAGWNTKADGTGTDYAPGDVISLSRSVTLYAKFANFPRAIFKSNYSGGPSDVFQIITPSTSTNLRLNSFSQTGYSFAGWDTEPLGGGTDYIDGASVNITSNLTLYAQWTANTYQVLFEYNGADGNNSATSDSYTTGGTAINLPNPTRTGYNFAGWFSSSTLSGNSLGATFAPSANQTIYAKWDAIEYTLTYLGTSKTSGLQPTDSDTYNYLELATIKANTGNMVRNGYRFLGWVVNPADANETPKNSGQTVQFADANLTLHPVWEAETYTITYNSNGATSGAPLSPTDSYTTGDGMFTLPGAGTLAKPGYEFVGWSTQSNGGAPLVAVAPNINLDLYATWELVDYNFTYDLNGGSGTAIAMQTGDVERSLTIQSEGDAQKTGHWFGGWNTEPNGSGDSYAPGTSVRVPVGGLQLYAIWVPNQYRISYNGNGGIGGPNITGGFDEATFGQDYLIRDKGTLSREGYNFLHWTTNAAGTGDRYDESQNSGELNIFRPSANTTFFAQWSPVQYSMTFDTAGGNASLGMPQKTIGQVLQLPSPGEKPGYTFSHWSHASAEYPEGSSFTVGAANATFTAVWTPNTYTVTYDWQGGQTSGLAQVGSPFTVGNGPMNLPDGSGYSRDGFDFAGWSQTPGGTPVSDFEPDNNAVLYALWQPGNFTLRFDVNTQGQPEASAAVPRGQATILPAPPSREGFVFTGWFDAEQNGLKVGDAGDSFTPNASTLLHANWVQKSLFGVDIAQLETGATINVGVAGSGGSVTVNHAPTNTSASVTVPNGALPQGTTISARYFREIDARQADLIPGDNKYIFSLLVSWMLGSGDSATVPMTDPDKPIEVRMTSDAIKAGQMIYQLIGDQYTELGRAEVDGELTVFLYEDPEIVVAATTPETPEIDSVEIGMNSATISWSEPVDGGSPITSYTVTSNPGGFTCTTVETSCTITGLSDDIQYTFTVLASNSVGDSAVSGSSEPISPEPTVYVVTYDSNGGSAVADGSFQVGNTIAPPLQPTRSGYTFLGWTTTLDDETTLVTFPYDPGVDSEITLYALWERNPVVVTPTPEEPGPAAGLPVVTGETKAWTKRISANTVKVYIKFPEMGKNYQIRIQKNNGEYVRLMSKTINSTADADLRVVGEWYYIVRTIELPGEGRYRIEILEDGERITLNGKDRPVVYSYINAV